MREYAFEFTSTPNSEIFCKFCDCIVKCDKKLEAHRCSAKHQRGSFHETESSHIFLKHAAPDLADKLFFVSFQQNNPIGLFSNTICEYTLYSAFQLKTQKLDRSKVKI